MSDVTIGIAFIAGLLSFFSPCVLPLIPSLISYLSGVSITQGEQRGLRMKVFLNSVFFVLGFAVVFSLLGVLLNSVLSNISYDLIIWLGRIGGIIIIGFGLYLLGFFKLEFLEREHKLKPFQTKYSFLTSAIFGASFAVGWTPCVGAVLGAVFTIAAVNPSIALPLFLAYSLGLGIPFLVVGAFTAQAASFIKKHNNFLKYFNKVVGVLLIILGILVFTDRLSQIASFDFVNQFLLKK